ncbi:nucleotide-binding protein [Stenotrophomonas sp. PS02301]|uniref:nucleotide-binding protein n=1 Tax=unclassified Stenotrophomonas TaxID=196198 RepID=UPI00249A4816|nr:nucleotide-binding protein [Stenotrophomonas sp. PS02301]
MTAVNLFEQINAAVLDLQASEPQSYERPLRRLGQLLVHPDLETANRLLTEGLDLQAFLVESENTGGGMSGSHRLVWPDNPTEQLGMMLLVVQDLASRPDHALSFCHQYFYSGRSIVAGIHSMTRQLLIPFVRDYKTYVLSQGRVEIKVIAQKSNRVFIVHGHDGEAREAVARFLTRAGLDPIILHEQANRGRTIIEKVEANSDVGFAVVLLTPDDEGRALGADKLEARARQNVLLELGYFIARLGRENVCTLKRGALEIPSDFAGVVWSTMDANGAWKQELAKELAAAEYEIDWNVVMR